ncbi:GRB10-interacting GYF protein 1 isoform X2 [Pelobates fuscus]|uniref:GRB10-interacting GYF protein 1 isoform X2 n=1 Tax=Pelobates fuscus TaxID=191477 RepID=UPI002FE43807
MAAETLNFGPEWLRALSSGGSISSPPPSPAMPKYKLAEYRYGREEMLALYIKEIKVPEEMQDKEFAVILNEEPLQPLALLPLTEEEQRNFSLSVNSVPVLRLMGKGAAAPPGGVARGRGTARGRGRGRGEAAIYTRAIEEGEPGFGRGNREIHRSQSWDDRGERRFEKPIRREAVRVGFEETSGPSRKEFARSDSDNWRTLRDGQEEDEDGNWRLAVTRRDERWRSTSPGASTGEMPRSAGWRDHAERRRKFDFDIGREDSGSNPRGRGDGNHDDERDGLPEWCMEDEDDEMGTFDSSGAFLSFKKCSKETILEEQELEFQGVEDEEEEKTGDTAERAHDNGISLAAEDTSHEPSSISPDPANSLWTTGMYADMEGERCPEISSTDGEDGALGEQQQGSGEEGDPGHFSSSLSPLSSLSSLPPPSSSPPVAATEFSVGDPEEDEGMKHLQQEAEKLVASLQDSSLEEDGFSSTRSHSAAALPLSHEAAMKWFYKDPQGEIQGPFSTQEMAEWCQAGYFTMSLLVKRGCDEGFQPLGEVIKMWGRVPFAPGPSPPPLLGNIDQQCLKKQQELALYQQLQHQYLLQLLNKPQYSPQQKSGELTPQQQQQLTLFLQQLNPSKSRGPDASSLLPAMNRSLSVPDTGSLWDLHTSATQTAGGDSAIWDLPAASQGPILEQLQLQQKERRDAELRAKREEEERKRREEKRRQEELKRRDQEEELYRRKQCRQQQELLLKLIQQSGQPSPPPHGWGSHSKGLTLKAMLEMQEREGQLLKQRGQSSRNAHGGLGMSGAAILPSQWGSDSGSLWGSLDKSPWEDSLKSGVSTRGLRNSRSSPSLTDAYSARRKKTEEEEKLLKLLQGIKPSDGFTQWCEQMLHILNTSNNLDVPTLVAFLKELESPYDVHDYIRSCLGETLEAKEFAKQFLERRAKYKASQRQQESTWLTPSMFPTSQNLKQSGFDAQSNKMKRRIHMLHSDPSILDYGSPVAPKHVNHTPSSISPDPGNTELYADMEVERCTEVSFIDGEDGPLGQQPGSGEEDDSAGQVIPSSSNYISDYPPPGATARFSVGDTEEDEYIEHLQQEASKLVASLQDSLSEKDFLPSNSAAAHPLSQEGAMKWFYMDTQGKIQGPFCTEEMAEWFNAQYFDKSILLRRECDEGFRPLGDFIKICGRVPFAPGPLIPPLLRNTDKKHLIKQRQMAKYMQLPSGYLFKLLQRSHNSSDEMPKANNDTKSIFATHATLFEATKHHEHCPSLCVKCLGKGQRMGGEG